MTSTAILGLAVPYGETCQRSGRARAKDLAPSEVVAPDAFRHFVKRPPLVVARVNHAGLPLGSTQDGRLTFWETAAGLYFYLRPRWGHIATSRVLDAVRRGAVRGVSVTWNAALGTRLRSRVIGNIERIIVADIREVSIVLPPNWPAYTRTFAIADRSIARQGVARVRRDVTRFLYLERWSTTTARLIAA